MWIYTTSWINFVSVLPNVWLYPRDVCNFQSFSSDDPPSSTRRNESRSCPRISRRIDCTIPRLSACSPLRACSFLSVVVSFFFSVAPLPLYFQCLMSNRLGRAGCKAHTQLPHSLMAWLLSLDSTMYQQRQSTHCCPSISIRPWGTQHHGRSAHPFAVADFIVLCCLSMNTLGDSFRPHPLVFAITTSVNPTIYI